MADKKSAKKGKKPGAPASDAPNLTPPKTLADLKVAIAEAPVFVDMRAEAPESVPVVAFPWDESAAEANTGRETQPFSPGPCCERDHDGDGNCDRHASPGVLRVATFAPKPAPWHRTDSASTRGTTSVTRIRDDLWAVHVDGRDCGTVGSREQGEAKLR